MANPDSRQDLQPGLGLTPGTIWVFPLGAQISIEAHNEIAVRQVMKKPYAGTIKEYWAQGDWSVSIQGWLINETLNEVGEETPPHADLERLRQLCRTNGPVYVQGFEFTHFGIERITITDLALPYTPNRANQRFIITAVSDTPVEVIGPAPGV